MTRQEAIKKIQDEALRAIEIVKLHNRGLLGAMMVAAITSQAYAQIREISARKDFAEQAEEILATC